MLIINHDKAYEILINWLEKESERIVMFWTDQTWS